jgi:hypothetical protein
MARHETLKSNVNNIFKDVMGASESGLKIKGKKSKSAYLSDKALVKRSRNIVSAIKLGNNSKNMKNELDSVFSAMLVRKIIKPNVVKRLTGLLGMK